MAQTSFPKRRMIVGKLNVRVEMHGDEEVPACDISLSGIPFDMEELDKLCGKYTSRSLYTEEGRGNSKVVKPALTIFKPLEIDAIYYKSRAVIGFTFNDKKIDLKKIKIKDVAVEPQDGGTTILSLKLQACPTDGEMAMLYAVQHKEQYVTLYFGTTVDEDEKPETDEKQNKLALGDASVPGGESDQATLQ